MAQTLSVQCKDKISKPETYHNIKKKTNISRQFHANLRDERYVGYPDDFAFFSRVGVVFVVRPATSKGVW